jgi:integrase
MVQSSNYPRVFSAGLQNTGSAGKLRPIPLSVIRAFLYPCKPATRKAYLRDLRHFGRYHALTLDVLELEPLVISNYFSRYQGPASPSTIRARLRTLKSLSNFLFKTGIIKQQAIIAARLMPPGECTLQDHLALSQELVRKILAHLDYRVQAGDIDAGIVRHFFVLLFGCGLRISEAMGLEMSDRTSLGLRLRNTKTKALEFTPLPIWVESRLSPCMPNVNYHWIHRRLKRLGSHFGIRLTAHCGRTTAITRLSERGISYRDIARFSRHSSIKSVERYDKNKNVITMEEY